jgi:hypothetical protein
MSVTVYCDYCGQVIEPGEMSAEIKALGDFPNEDAYRGRQFHNFAVGNYHTEPRESGKACYWRIKDSIDLTEETGPTLETIETLSNQQVAYRRRQFRKHEET